MYSLSICLKLCQKSLLFPLIFSCLNQFALNILFTHNRKRPKWYWKKTIWGRDDLVVGVNKTIVNNSGDISNRIHIAVNSYSKLFLKSCIQQNLHIGDFSLIVLLEAIITKYMWLENINAISWHLNVEVFLKKCFFFKENSSYKLEYSFSGSQLNLPSCACYLVLMPSNECSTSWELFLKWSSRTAQNMILV